MKAPLALLASTIIMCTLLGCASEPMNVGALTEQNNALSSKVCIENLRMMFGAIDQYCIENCETNGAVVSADVLASDPTLDIAVLRTERPLPALERASVPGIGEEVIAVGSPLGLGTSVASGVVSAVDRNVQEDARNARWSGEAMAGVYLAARQPVDLSRETNAEMALSFDVQVNEHPTSSVQLRMHCGGEDCAGIVDITELLKGVPAGQWSNITLSLRRFEDAKVDMSSIVIPFGLSSDGALDLTFSNVRLECGPESEVACPPE